MNQPTPEHILQTLGLELPPAPKATARYKPAIIVGNQVWVSGHTPDDAGPTIFGSVPDAVTVEQAQKSAEQTGLAILASVKAVVGELSHVQRVLFAEGKVNCGHDFTDHPKVINGFSDLMAKVFGEEAGIGTRNATGAVSLPDNVPVEITQVIFELKPSWNKPKRSKSRSAQRR